MKVLKLTKPWFGILQTMFTLQTMVTHCFEQQNKWIHLVAYIWMTFEFRALAFWTCNSIWFYFAIWIETHWFCFANLNWITLYKPFGLRPLHMFWTKFRWCPKQIICIQLCSKCLLTFNDWRPFFMGTPCVSHTLLFLYMVLAFQVW